MGFSLKKVGRAFKKATGQVHGAVVGGVMSGVNATLVGVGGKSIKSDSGVGKVLTAGNNDAARQYDKINKEVYDDNAQTWRDGTRIAAITAAGVMTGGLAYGAAGAVAGGVLAGGYAGTKTYGQRAAEHQAKLDAREAERNRIAAAGGQAGEGQATSGGFGAELQVTDPLEEVAKRKRRANGQRVFGSGAGVGQAVLGSTSKLGAA